MQLPTAIQEVLEFVLDDVHYGVPTIRVLEVAPRVRITPLPAAPKHVRGVVAYRGLLAVAIDLRECLGHPTRAPRLDDQLIIAKTRSRVVALIVDRADGLRLVDSQFIQSTTLANRHVTGVVPMADGMLLLQDLDAVLSLDEEAAVDRALAAPATG